jgi:hypothetical protein
MKTTLLMLWYTVFSIVLEADPNRLQGLELAVLD